MSEHHLTLFEAERRRLAALAYRMTGSVADTEDILQQVWLRFADQDPNAIDSPERWLSTVTAHLCLDHWKSARVRRETYVGAWLPEPLITAVAASPEQQRLVAEDVSIALLLMLDQLTPDMRAALLLRDAFDYDYDEIATVLRRSPVTCRQLVSRARRRMTGIPQAPAASIEEARPIVTAFWRASREGDMQGLLDLFAEDIEVRTDGGGKVMAAINVLTGRRRAAGLFVGVARKWPQPIHACPPLVRINGAPGFVSTEHDGVTQTTALGLRDGQIAAIWIVRNPDKLRHLET